MFAGLLAYVVTVCLGVTACGKKEASPPPPSAIAVAALTVTPQDTRAAVAKASAPIAGSQARGSAKPQRIAATTGTAKPTQDRLEIQAQGGQTVVNVYHVRGIGGFELFQPRSGWPASVIVRLHGFPALEMFRAKGADGLLTCELQRPENQTPNQVCKVGNARIDVLSRQGGVYVVTLPLDQLAANGGSVEVRWVDQWR